MTIKIIDGDMFKDFPTARELHELTFNYNKENQDKTTKEFLAQILDNARDVAKETCFSSFSWEGTNYPIGVNLSLIREELSRLGYCNISISRERHIGGKITISFSW